MAFLVLLKVLREHPLQAVLVSCQYFYSVSLTWFRNKRHILKQGSKIISGEKMWKIIEQRTTVERKPEVEQQGETSSPPQ